jgi:glutamate--cysteine ligase
MRENYGGSYPRFALAQSLQHGRALRAEPLSDAILARFTELAARSLAEQRAIEAADDVPFDRYLQQYLSPAALRPG